MGPMTQLVSSLGGQRADPMTAFGPQSLKVWQKLSQSQPALATRTGLNLRRR
jgi:hypothetical protein